MSQTREKIEVFVKRITHEAKGISSFELRPVAGGDLPAFTPGAHIDIELGNGLTRSYSLTNAPAQHDCYVIAVNNDANSRGGSRFVHERLRVGDRLTIAAPANNFELDGNAAHSVLIAGGIGVTPIWSMIQQLSQRGSSWEVHYASRAQENAAFLAEIAAAAASAGKAAHFHHDDQAGGAVLDMQAIVDAAPEGSVFYCCGPGAMMEAYKAATSELPAERVRMEYFSAQEAPPPSGDTLENFTVVLAKSGKELEVEEGVTILETLLQNGIPMNYSCTQGVCGTCVTKVLEGTPDHRDWVLSDDQKALNDKMMVCCSLSKSERLVLDL